MNDILTVQKRLLIALEDIRRKNVGFRYKPRQRDNNERLSAGYFFIGNEQYVMVGLAEGGDSLRKIHNVGFVVSCDGRAHLSFSAKYDNEKSELLRDIAEQLGMKKTAEDRWNKTYETQDYEEALRMCVASDLPIILNAIRANENNTKIKEISQSKFQRYLSKIQQLQIIEDKIARICWNENGWQTPSGRHGKSENTYSYENIKGYGHEEWLFNPTRIIDGYYYSFLQQVNTTNRTHVGRMYNIHLYTINPNKQRCYVGYINNVECIDEQLSESVNTTYRKNGWLSEMEDEVNSKLLSPDERVSIEYFNFNIRFKSSDVHIGELRIISDEDPHFKNNRYNLQNKQNNEEFKFDTIENDIIYGSANKKRTETRTRTASRMTSFEPVHDKMQNNIVEILQKEEESKIVVTEQDHVDIKVHLHNGDFHYYEVKTDIVKLSIRQALGQILEYNHYPNNKRAVKLFVVSHFRPNEDDVKYINFLRDNYNIPLYYRYYDFDTNTLSDIH